MNEEKITKARDLREVVRNFRQDTPLDPKDKEMWDAFYVETKRDEIDEIIRNILDTHLEFMKRSVWKRK